jgi:hypothetical protein
MSMAVTFEKRDWGSGRLTWRERRDGRRMLGPSRYALRRISNKQAKRRWMSGDMSRTY